MARYKVLYFDCATPEVYEIIRSQLPRGFDLLTLDSDSDVERHEKIALADFVLVATAEINDAFLNAAHRLKLIQHQGVGYDGTDVAAAQRLGIPVGLTPEGTSIGVAEHTILLILAVYKKLIVAHNSLVAGRWRQFDLRPYSYELFGKKLGLLGFGRIGAEVAKRATAFGAHILICDSEVSLSADRQAALGVQQVSRRTLLQNSDIVSLHVPLTPATRGFVNREFLQAMKRSAILVNTSRGGVVDQGALIEALQKGVIQGAGLDVFAPEPLEADSPLCSMEQVVLTPHIAAGTRDALVAKMRAAFANMVRVGQGKRPTNLVDSDMPSVRRRGARLGR
jgi:phosphoglycerate dehydrogenase-like enzyme